jgi:lipoprotein-anchoring transpeptidase ErfK/SrfK
VLSLVSRLFATVAALFLAACAKDRVHKMVVSVPDQKMALYKKGQLVKVYDISTSRFCLSTRPGTNGTPLGSHEVAKKIGGGQPMGMKFKSRQATGEIVRVNAPGRDPIVTRILWLKGLESANRTSFSRTIYIHGTPEEWKIGTPASYGCVRMRSRDIMDLYDTIGMGATVDIVNRTLALPPALVPPAQQVGTAQVAHVKKTATPTKL